MDGVRHFSHAALPDSRSHIRLLEILHGGFGEHVVCSLSTWTITDAPSYYALSYTWGDPASTADITINGWPMCVRKNCEYVMQQMFALQASRFYWLDAICINQASTQEKNDQVALMGTIYKNAAHVLACLGEHADDSEFLLHILSEKAPLFDRIHARIQPYAIKKGSWRIPNPILQRWWLMLQCFFTMDASLRQRLVNAFLAFMSRPYFTRVWVLQELHMATEVSYCCGKDMRSFDHVLSLSMLVDFWIDRTGPFPPAIIKNFLSLIPRESHFLHRRHVCRPFYYKFNYTESQRGALALASGSRGPRRLSEVVEAMQYFQCADVRDKLYGTLSLVDWHGDAVPIPDYANESFETAKKTLGIFLRRRESAPSTGTPVEWAWSLYKLFEVSSDQEAVQRAVQKRLIKTVELDEVHSIREHTSLTDTNWRGTQLFYKEPNDSPSPSLRFSSSPSRYHNHQTGIYIRGPTDQLPHVNYVRLVDGSGRCIACAPHDTQEGDWYLTSTPSTPAILKGLGVIVRASGDHYTFIGQAGSTQRAGVGGEYGWTTFEVFWHPEDLILLDWMNTLCPELYSSSMEGWLSWRVCGSKDSSFAVKSAEPSALG